MQDKDHVKAFLLESGYKNDEIIAAITELEKETDFTQLDYITAVSRIIDYLTNPVNDEDEKDIDDDDDDDDNDNDDQYNDEDLKLDEKLSGIDGFD